MIKLNASPFVRFLQPASFRMLTVILALAAVLAAHTSLAQTAVLLALSKSDHSLALVDPLSLKVMTRIPVGNDPHEVVASADGKTAYVSIYGGGSLHEIDRIDLMARKPLASLDTRPFLGPHGLDFAGGKLWFTAEGTKTIARYDPQSGSIDWCMGTGQDRTHMIRVAGHGDRIYTTNVASGTVSVIRYSGPRPGRQGAAGMRPQAAWTQQLIAVSKGVEGFDVSPDGKELWAAAADDGSIAVIDAVSGNLKATLDVGVRGANRLKFTPDGRRVLVTSLQSGDLAVFDTQSRSVLRHIPVGHGAAGIVLDPDGSRAFIACTPDNYVALIDLGSLTVSAHIEVGSGPDGLAWAVLP